MNDHDLICPHCMIGINQDIGGVPALTINNFMPGTCTTCGQNVPSQAGSYIDKVHISRWRKSDEFFIRFPVLCAGKETITEIFKWLMGKRLPTRIAGISMSEEIAWRIIWNTLYRPVMDELYSHVVANGLIEARKNQPSIIKAVLDRQWPEVAEGGEDA